MEKTYKMKVVDICWKNIESKEEVNHLPKEIELMYNDEMVEKYGDLDTIAGVLLNIMFDRYETYDYYVL